MSVADHFGAIMPRDVISAQQINIQFVKSVQKHPCLYNYTLPEYSRKDVSDKAWEDVAEATNMSPSACRERWRNLRAVYMRTLKQKIAGTKKTAYYLSEYMQFLVPFLQPTSMNEADKQKLQNMENSWLKELRSPSMELEDVKIESLDDDTVQSDHSGSQDWNVEVSRKRPLDIEEDQPTTSKKTTIPVSVNNCANIFEKSDPVTSFIISLMPELREMNTDQFKRFKRRVLTLIDDITSEMENTSHNESECIT